MPGPTELLTPDTLGTSLLTRRDSPLGSCRFVAVDGWSGSGKTALAERLAPSLGCPCFHLDDLVPGWSGLARSIELLVAWVLAPLAAATPARWRRWDWEIGTFGKWEVIAPAEVVVIEGCGAGSALARPWLSALIWIAVDDDERVRRLKARPDWPTYAPWADMWAEQERALRAGEDPRASADAIVETSGDPLGELRVTWMPASGGLST